MTATDATPDAVAGRLPKVVRFAILMAAWIIAVSAAVAPIVYLLRRMGVG